jgi:hypothetical protein
LGEIFISIDKTRVAYDTYDVAAFSLSPEDDKKYDAFRYLYCNVAGTWGTTTPHRHLIIEGYNLKGFIS